MILKKAKTRLSQPKVIGFSKNELEFLNLCAEIIVEIVLEDEARRRTKVSDKPIPHKKRNIQRREIVPMVMKRNGFKPISS